MVSPVTSTPLADLLSRPAQSPRPRADPDDKVFLQQVLALLQQSAGRLGLKAETVEAVKPKLEDDAAASNSSGRRFLVAFSPAASAPQASPAAPSNSYVPPDVSIPASDVGTINAQQSARNAAFREWVGKISADLEAMGYRAEVAFEQSLSDWFVCPIIARVRFPDLSPNFEDALALHHYDAWQDIEPAGLILNRALASQEA